jgi:hypothetical protein
MAPLDGRTALRTGEKNAGAMGLALCARGGPQESHTGMNCACVRRSGDGGAPGERRGWSKLLPHTLGKLAPVARPRERCSRPCNTMNTFGQWLTSNWVRTAAAVARTCEARPASTSFQHFSLHPPRCAGLHPSQQRHAVAVHHLAPAHEPSRPAEHHDLDWDSLRSQRCGLRSLPETGGLSQRHLACHHDLRGVRNAGAVPSAATGEPPTGQHSRPYGLPRLLTLSRAAARTGVRQASQPAPFHAPASFS